MHINEINQATIPVLKTFHVKLTFDDSPWTEAIPFQADECGEFQYVNDITPKPENLIAAGGFVKDENRQEYQAYAVYSYNGAVHFMSIRIGNEIHTYDYARAVWVKWNHEANNH